MPCKGFICPYSGKDTPFDYCTSKCPINCMSQPLLMALIRENREEPNVFHVTELATPEQIVYLKRTCDYFIHPFNLIWAVLGTAVHTIIEGQKDKLDPARYIMEESFEVDMGYAKIRGRADVYDTEAKILYDYKTMKGYKAKRLMDGEWKDEPYMWQLNFYRKLAFPEAKTLMIEALIKDWSRAMQDSDNVHPIERVEVPILADEQVERQLQAWLHKHTTNLSGGTTPAPCKQSDVWFNTNPRSKNCGVPLRCRDYCEVSSKCQQYAQFLEGASDAERARVYPKR